MSLILILAILIRIPRNGKLTGDDAFTLSWYAWAISKGQGSTFLIHPLSFFGAYPFSGYPIFTEVLLALFLVLTNNVFISWILTGSTLAVMSVFSIYFLAKILELPELYADFIGFFYIISPIFVLYNLGSVSARGTFLAVLPLFIGSNFMVIKKLNLRNILFSLFCTALLLTTHRISFIVTPVILIVIPLSFVSNKFISGNLFEELKSKIIENYKILFLVVSLAFIPLGLISTHIFTIEPLKLGIPGLDDYSPGLITLFELLGLQFANQGIVASFAVISILIILILDLRDFPSVSKHVPVMLLFYVVYVITQLFITISWYAGLLYVISLSFIAAVPFYIITKVSGVTKNVIISGISLFGILYIVFLEIIIPNFKPEQTSEMIYIEILYLFFFSVLGVLIMYNFMFSKPNIKYRDSIFIITVLLLSSTSTLSYTDSITIESDSTFPYNYVSDEEMDIAEYIRTLNSTGRFLSSNFKIGSRLMGLTGIPFYADDLGGSGFISGYLNETEVKNNSELKPITTWWQDAYIYNDNSAKGRISNIWWSIFNYPVYDNYVTQIFKSENTRYIVLMNDLSVTYGDTFYGGQFVNSFFFDGYGELKLQTDHLSVFYLNETIF